MSQLILQGLGGPMIVCQGYGASGPGPQAQTFRQALVAKVRGIPELLALVGNAVYPDVIPQTHDLGANGPALTYTIVTYPRGQVLSGLDGTGNARVQFSAWSYQKSQSDQIALALLSALSVVPVANPWGNGSIVIKSVTHQDESDQTEKAKDGSDRYIYQIINEYQINHYLA